MPHQWHITYALYIMHNHTYSILSQDVIITYSFSAYLTRDISQHYYTIIHDRIML